MANVSHKFSMRDSERDCRREMEFKGRKKDNFTGENVDIYIKKKLSNMKPYR